MTPFDLLRQLNELDEHPRIEAKKGSEIGKSILETICAYANEPGMNGGWLLLGVEPDEQAFWPQYEVTGVQAPDKLQADLTSRCANNFNIPIRPQIEIAEIQGKRVLSIFVPEASTASKPVFFNAIGLPKGAFRRIGSSDVRCTHEDMAVFYGDHPSQSLDATVLPDAEMEEIDASCVAEYRRLRAKQNPGAEELDWSDGDLLRALRCAGFDNKHKLRPTLAGMLLFGGTIGLRRHFPMARVDYIRIPGRQWVEDSERRFETIEMRAPLIRLVNRAISAILDDLPKTFSLTEDAIQREDLPIIPIRVLREAVVNAVMHRSYRVHSPVQIIRYSNRIEIRNPGYSLVAEERWGDPGSVTRNPHLAAVLHEINFAETKGSGIRVMRQSMREANLTPPTFESDRRKDLFVATLLFHHFLGPEDWEWLRSLGIPALSDEEARALVYVRETSSIDNATYRDLNQVDVLNASQHLRRLRDQHLLEQRGKGSATFYVPTGSFVTSLPSKETEGFSEEDGKWTSTTVRTVQAPSESASKPSKVPEKPDMAEEQPIQVSTGPIQVSDIPSDLQEQIAKLGKKPPPSALRAVIVTACAWKPLSASDLARMLQRSRTYLLNSHLQALVASGELELTRPEQLTHPRQAYRSAGSQ